MASITRALPGDHNIYESHVVRVRVKFHGNNGGGGVLFFFFKRSYQVEKTVAC